MQSIQHRYQSSFFDSSCLLPTSTALTGSGILIFHRFHHRSIQFTCIQLSFSPVIHDQVHDDRSSHGSHNNYDFFCEVVMVELMKVIQGNAFGYLRDSSNNLNIHVFEFL